MRSQAHCRKRTLQRIIRWRRREKRKTALPATAARAKVDSAAAFVLRRT